jgi:hypothetical protein
MDITTLCSKTKGGENPPKKLYQIIFNENFDNILSIGNSCTLINICLVYKNMLWWFYDYLSWF